MAMEFERIGYINAFVCKQCQWMTMTVNLNNGKTAEVIGCNNRDQNVVDGVIDTSDGFEAGSAMNPHLAINMGYNPMPGWFSMVKEKSVNIQEGTTDVQEQMRMWVERVWIRPTKDYIKKIAKNDEVYQHILSNCRSGGLLLCDISANYDRAEPFTNYGADPEETQAYLDSIYGKE